MAILSNGKFYGFLCSVKETGQKLANGAKEYVEDFVSGFVGHGWKIWEYVKGKWMLEIDAIRVRGQFTVFELLVSKIRAIIGAQAITQGHAKIKSVTIADSEVYKESKTEIYAEDFTNSKWVKLAADNLIISSGTITVNGSSAFSPTLFVESVTNAINSFKFSIAGLKKSIQLTWTDKEGAMQMMEITEDGEYEFPQSYQLVDSPLETQRVGIIINNTEDAVVIKQQAISFEYSSFKTTEQCYCLEIEDDINTISEYDFIRCQSPVKKYHVQVGSVSDKFINVPVSEFEVDEEGNAINPPEVGDEVVQFGNGSHIETYIGRHSAIYLHADESGQPAIDVLDGIYSKELNDCLKVRMGGDIPGTEGLKGLYTVNGMIKGVDDSGHITYCLYPDGTAELGDSSALFRPDKSGYIAGGAIAWKWDDDKGAYVCSMKDVQVEWDGVKNSPEWIKDWTKEGTFIGDKFVAAPHGFFGTKDDKEQLTGILLGDKVMVNGVERSGIFALVDNDVVFELDPISGKYKFSGEVKATNGSIGGWTISDDGISSEEIEQSSDRSICKNQTILKKDGTISGNLLKVSLDGGLIRTNLWDYPIMEWSERKLDIHAIVSTPFESGYIEQPSLRPIGGDPNIVRFTRRTSNMMLQPSFLSSDSGRNNVVYYRLPTNLEFNGVTFRFFNPATRISTWKACNAVLIYNIDIEDSKYWTNLSGKTSFLGNYTGTDLQIPPGRMAVITGVAEPISDGGHNDFKIKWYVEIAP